MAIEVGTAYISILPSTSMLAPAIRKELGVIEGMAVGSGRRTGKRFGSAMAGAAKVGGLALAVGIGAVVKSSVDLEQKFSQTMNVIGATTKAPAKELGKLQKMALDLGAATSFSASEAADAMLELAKAGLTPATIQAGALEGTLQLAAAGGTSLASAATIASNALNTFNLEGKDMGRISAALAGGANASTASVESLGMALGQVGPGAKNAGLDLNDTVGVLAAFDNAGIKGSDAGTSLKTMLTRLVPQTAKAATAMKDLGLNFTDANGNFLSIEEIAGQLQTSLRGLSQAERTTALSTIFGSDATRAATVLMEEGTKGVTQYIKATKDSSAAQKAADARMKGTAGALERLSGAWETVRLRIGLALGPAVVKAADGMGFLLDKIGDGITVAANKLPALVAGFQDMATWIRANNTWLGPLVVAVAAFGSVVGIAPAIFKLTMAIRLFSVASTIATVKQWALNAAVLANPYVLIIAAIVALVAGLVWFFTQTELGRKIISVAWNGIKTAVSAVVSWFQNSVVPILAAVWSGIVAGAMGVWSAMKAVWGFMKSVWAGIVITAKVAWLVLKVIFVAIATAFVLMWKWIKAVWSVTGAPIFRGISKAASATWSWLKDKVFKPMKLGFQLMALGFVLAYRRYIKPAWEALVNAGKRAWAWIKDRIFKPLKDAWWALARLQTRLVNEYIKPAWRAIVDAGKAAWNWIRDRIFKPLKDAWWALARLQVRLVDKYVKPAWEGIKSAGKAAWDWIDQNVFKHFKTGIAAIGDAFKSVKKVIKSAWNGIKKAAAAPVNFVIDEVYNRGIRDAWNGVADSVGLPLKLPHMDRIKGYATGGWTGNGSRLTPAGVVHADEFVVKKSSRRKFESRNPGVLDHINRTGEAPGFAGGGLVPGASDWWRKRGAALSEHPAFGGVTFGGHMPGSLHYSGQAIDLNYRNGNETSFFDKWIPAFRQAFPGMGTIWRAPGHYNHAHIDTGGHSLGMGASGTRGGGGGGIGSAIASAIAKIAAIGPKIKEGVGSSPIGRIVGAMGRKLINGAKDKLGDFDPMAAVGAVGNAVNKGTAKAQVRTVAALRGWGFGKQWDAIDWIVNKESSWDPKAANGTSSARGLFQKMTSLHGPVEKTAAGQARWGLGYIADNYGNPVNAMREHMAKGWYADGGLVKAGLFDSGGMLQPNGVAVNLSGKPEGILTNAESRALKAGGSIHRVKASDDEAEPIQKRERQITVRIGTRDFEGYMTEIAEDAIDAAGEFAGTRGRMG